MAHGSPTGGRRRAVKRRMAMACDPDGIRVVAGGPVPPGAAAITVGSWIFVRRGYEDHALLLRHERVHVAQYRAYGFVGFLVRYGADYLRWRRRGYGHWAAYRRIPFEIDADWRSRRPGGLDPR